MVAQIPTLPSGAIETWLLAGFAVLSMVALGIRVFIRRPPLEAEFVTKEEFRIFRAAVERDLSGLRDRIDSRHLALIEALEKLRCDLLGDAERRSRSLETRLSQMEAGLARLDERTK